ncbi:alg13 [Bugula neritina]|uniref:UDP-N-acetylglucosamine transferase subunit ALG13 n=1 Tax=Bugula neritina TaxID=10212 RepID=A0A7J7JUA6_BUGNE|nr:alg13 [Bugula neritina]
MEVLLEKGYRSLCIQAGSSEVGEVMLTKAKSKLPGFQVSWFSYKPNILADINAADLVISHAGAGSCLEIMHANKPCIVVVNDKLMGNHQVELAEKLSSLGHTEYTTPSHLIETVQSFRSENLLPYEPGDPKRLSKHLHQLMGLLYSD